MKTILAQISLCFIAFLTSGICFVQAQVGITLEEYTESTYGTTYRLYANFNETANITSVFAPEAIYDSQTWPGLDPSDSADDLPAGSIPAIFFGTDAPNGFFQFALGTQHYNTPLGIIASLFAVFPEMEFDSWFTIGGAEGAAAGVQFMPGQNEALNSFNADGVFNTEGLSDGGGWYTATSTPFFTDSNNQILLAQLTVDDDASIDVVLSLIWRDANDVSHVEVGLTAAVGDSGIGCMISTACNYDASATEAGDCIYVENACDSCSGESDGSGIVVSNDSDNDGICNGDEILGCQNIGACNYNENATDSGTCAFATGCESCSGSPVDGSGFIQDNDTDGDGVCDSDEILGCTDGLACNFYAQATEDDSSCVLPINCETCSGATDGSGTVVTNDADADGVCDVDEIIGCQDLVACNYNALATDDSDLCVYAIGCEFCSGATDGSGTILNGDGDTDGICDVDEVSGCLDSSACNYNTNATDSAECDYATGCAECSGASDGTGIVISNDEDDDGICNADEISGCTDTAACNFASLATDDNGSCQYPVGCDTCSGSVDGNGVVVDNDQDNDGVCDSNEIVGCQISGACNYNSNATDSGDCSYPAAGYDCVGACLSDFDGDGVCDDFEINGCVYPLACNYNLLATEDDGSCVFASSGYDCSGNCLFDADQDGVCDQVETVGCLETSACNYDTNATESGYCDYPETGYDCNGDCLIDSDQDGICDAFETAGCMNPAAIDYYALATDDDGSCTLQVTGCTYAWAYNFNPLATIDDGTCSDISDNCDDDAACNYTIGSDNDEDCYYPASDYDCNGVCLNDSDQDGICDNLEINGCTDLVACNYNSEATDDDGLCEFAVNGYDCLGQCLFDLDQDGVCDQSEAVGCLDVFACNYDATATESGFCDYPAVGYDCNGTCLIDSDEDGICNGFEVGGCMDHFACNFQGSATDDDGSCTFADFGYDCGGNCLLDSDADGICDHLELTGCQDMTACNYDELATDSGYCVYPEVGYDCAENCLNDSDEDGVCDIYEIGGCMDGSACNFDPNASDSDGSCVFADTGLDCAGNCMFDADLDGVCDELEITGCMDITACNFNQLATDTGYCEFPEAGYDCTGTCITDTDNDGVCDMFETSGCIDPDANNYNSCATDDDGSCEFFVFGCTYFDACNFNAEASFDDGLCNWECFGCMNSSAENYNPDATEDTGDCIFCTEEFDTESICIGDLNEDGIRGTADLLSLLSYFGMICED